jgi:hypothetical protein
MAFVEHFHGLLGGVGHMAQGVTFHACRRFGNGRAAYSGNLLYVNFAIWKLALFFQYCSPSDPRLPSAPLSFL